jgi:hypothetical protein
MDLEYILVILTNLNLKRGAEDGLEDSAHYANCATTRSEMIDGSGTYASNTHELEVEA